MKVVYDSKLAQFYAINVQLWNPLWIYSLKSCINKLQKCGNDFMMMVLLTVLYMW